MRIVLIGALLAMSACSVKKDDPDATASTSATTPPPPPSPVAQTPVAARQVQEENDLYSFTYSYPAAAGAIAPLKAILDAELERARFDLKADASKAKTLSDANGFPYNPYSYSVKWEVVTDLPGWLSMSALIGTYTGGAHPNSAFATLLWDRIAGLRREPSDLFVSKAALTDAIRVPFCRELDRQRAVKRRGQEAGEISEFSKCIDPAAETVILGSSNGKAFDRIGVLVAPYSAGPYAEGAYEVTVPVTQRVLAAVKPEFRATFVAQ